MNEVNEQTVAQGLDGFLNARGLEAAGKKSLFGMLACSAVSALWTMLATYLICANGLSAVWIAVACLPMILILPAIAFAFSKRVSRMAKELREQVGRMSMDRIFLNALLEHFPGHIYFKDRESRFFKVSRLLANKFGLKGPADAAGKSDFDFFTDDHARPAFDDEQEIVRTGVPLIDKVEHETWVDGRETWGSTTKMPLLDAEGRIIGTFGVTLDITERKLAEEGLKESQALFDSVVNSLPQSVYCKDKDGRFTFGNATFCATMNKSLEEVIGKTDFELFPVEQAKKYRQDDEVVIQTERPLETIEERAGSDGKTSYIQVVKAPTFDSRLQVRGVQAIFWDVTEKKLAEEELAHERDLLYALMDNIPDTIYFKDTESRFVRINKAMHPVLKVSSPADYVGKTDLDFFATEHARRAYEDEQEIIKTGRPLIGKVEKAKKEDGTYRWVMSTKVPIRDKEGKITGLVGMSKNITEHKEAEEALERGMKEFQEVVKAVSQGDLTKRGANGSDTLGRIAESVNLMLDNFSRMLSQVKELGISVSSSAVQILAASEQIAEGSQRQTDEITGTSSSVEEMAASMRQVSQHAETAAESAHRALEMADRGEKSVVDTAEAMSRIETAFQQTADKMRMLGRSSLEISEIIELINDIATQTNLLSLNAAIEAAHAGDAGLGFSVVAEEIRKLAERSARATKDVRDLIKSIQNDTTEAVEAMEKGMDEVTSGSVLAGQARQALRDISTVVKDSSQMMEEISAASEEQTRVTTAIARAMQMISSITVQTSSGAHESARTIESLAQLAERLNDAISQFKISDALERQTVS